MKSKYYMADSEREVMEMLWKQPEEIKQSALLELFQAEGKQWKRQTLNTFLSRLEEKGLVVRKSRMVKAACTEADLNQLMMQEAIDNLYGGKLSNLVLAFAEKKAVHSEDAKALMEIAEKLTEK